MKETLHQLQIFYELAINIGLSLDLREMLNKALLTYLRKFNGSAALVYKINFLTNNSIEVKNISNLPIRLKPGESFSKVHGKLMAINTIEKLDAFIAQTPQTYALGEKYCHIMTLPEFGFLVFVKNQTALEPYILEPLQEINEKLAIAAKVCMNNDALIESEKRFQTLSDSSLESMFFVSDGKIINQNNTATKTFDYTLHEALHTPIEKRLDSKFRHVLIKNLASQTEGLFEAIAKTKDNSTFPCEIQFHETLYKGETIKVVAIRDITQRKNAEQTQKEIEERYSVITQSTIDVIFMLNKSGKITFVNRSIRSFGYEPEEIVGKSFTQFVPKKEIPAYLAKLADVFMDKAIRNFNTKIVNKNGDLIDVEINGKLITQNGKHVGIGSIRDVSERKFAEQTIAQNNKKLNEYAERLEMAILGSNAGLWDWNVETGYLHVNEQWCELLGHNPEEVKPHLSSWEQSVYKNDMKRVVELLQMHMKGETEIYSSEHRMVRKTGEVFWVLDTGKVTQKDENGKPLRVVGTIIDITERKKSEIITRIEQTLAYELSKAKNLNETLQTCLKTAIDTSGMDSGGIYIFNHHTESLELVEHMGLSDQFVEQSTRFEKNSPQFNMLNDNRYTFINLANESGSEGMRYENENLKSIAILPIFYLGKLLGCLNIGSKKYTDIPDFSRQIMIKISEYVAHFIQQSVNEEVTSMQRQNLNTLFNSINDFMFILDEDANIIYTNTIVHEKLGYDEQELAGKNVLLVHPEAQRNEALNKVQAMLRGEATVCDVPLISRDGTLIPVETKITLGKWNNKKALFGISRDVTERQNANKQLNEQREALKNNLKQQTLLSEIALELNQLEVFENQINTVIQKIGQHTDVSRVYIFEDDQSGLLTNNTFEWCNTGIVPQMNELQEIPYEVIPSWRKFLDEKGRVYSENIFELPQDLINILEPQGIKSIIVYPLYLNGKFKGFIGFDECVRNKHWSRSELELLRTVSGIIANAFERRIMEKSIIDERDKANQANQAKSEFLSNMSHEIRTPMNGILGFSEALYHKLEKPELKKMVKSVLSSGNLLMSLLNDILDLSKIEAGKLEISPQPIDLKHIIEETRMLFSQKADKKQVAININYDDKTPEIITLDEIRIKQVLFNIVGNAIKFTHQGYVNIRTQYNPSSDKTGDLSIHIEDTGIGIEADQYARIFEAFSQQSGQSNRKYGGTGLGLAISKRLIEKMGGKISVESTVGKGSTFRIFIPNVQTSDVQLIGESNKTLTHNIQFHQATLLVIDDVSTNIQTIENLLEATSLNIISADSGEIGLEILNHTRPDVILLDLRMPGIDGFETARRIKQHPELNKIPIIAFTASVFSYKKIEDSEFFDGYLLKPVKRASLFAELSTHLKYENVETTEELEAQPTISEQTPLTETFVNKDELIHKLQTHYLPKWENLKGSLVLFNIEDFAKELKTLGEIHHAQLVKSYANKLLSDIDEVDLEALQPDLNEFQKMVNLIVSSQP